MWPGEGFASLKNALEELKCSWCLLPLSVPPITYTRNKTLVCGRCKNRLGNEPDMSHAKLFETLAELINSFPCRFATNGCPERTLKWKAAKFHELACDYRVLTCSTVSLIKCSWRGNPKALLKHFEENHKNLTINSNELDLLPLGLKGITIKLVKKADLVFLLQFKNSPQEGRILFGLALVVPEEEISEKLTYKLELVNPYNEDKREEFQGPVDFNYCEWQFDESRMLEIDVRSIKTSLEISKFANVRYRIDIIDSEDLQVIKELMDQTSLERTNLVLNRNLLNILKCLICNEFMRKEVYICSRCGQSICENCKQRVEQCPFCKKIYRNPPVHNFIAESVARNVVYPCVNKCYGCDFVGGCDEMEQHHENCPFNENCP